MDYVIIAMDSHGNIDWGDGQKFERSAAEREAFNRNVAADRNGSDWQYMLQPACGWNEG